MRLKRRSVCQIVDNCRLKGFTVVEMLVVISIFALLVARLIPAVQAARESARRVNCTSNLKQLGIAITAYNSTMGVLPLSNNGRSGYSVHSMILPNLEQMLLFNSINFDVPVYKSANITSRIANIDVLVCPSDKDDSKVWGWTSYACNTGYGYQIYNKFNGSFAKSPDSTSLASMLDGTSSTAMMSEWVQGSGRLTQSSDRLTTVYFTKPLLLSDQFDQAVSNCLSLSDVANDDLYHNKGMIWLQTGLGSTLYNHNIVPNGNSCLNGTNLMEGSWTSSSRHNGGANVLFADGHVKFIHNTISTLTWRALGTRSGNESISEGNY